MRSGKLQNFFWLVRIVQIKYAIVIQYCRRPEILVSLLLNGIPLVLPVDQILRNTYLDARFIGGIAVLRAAPA